uniref:Transposase Tc1-like domain-containing protein n=1 Tax=Oncorhynchus tshawytscha TaxID=74940 RepID=A0AAZ3PE51_ONCTS
MLSLRLLPTGAPVCPELPESPVCPELPESHTSQELPEPPVSQELPEPFITSVLPESPFTPKMPESPDTPALPVSHFTPELPESPACPVLPESPVHSGPVARVPNPRSVLTFFHYRPALHRPAKMITRAQRRMLNEVKTNSRMSAKDLRKYLEDANISVDKSTINKTLNKNGVHGRRPWKMPLVSKKNIAARLKFPKLQTKFVLFGRNTQHYVWRKPTVKYG